MSHVAITEFIISGAAGTQLTIAEASEIFGIVSKLSAQWNGPLSVQIGQRTLNVTRDPNRHDRFIVGP
jgi:hypothetical protein